MTKFNNLQDLQDMLREANKRVAISSLTRQAREEKIPGIFKTSNSIRSPWAITHEDALTFVRRYGRA